MPMNARILVLRFPFGIIGWPTVLPRRRSFALMTAVTARERGRPRVLQEKRDAISMRKWRSSMRKASRARPWPASRPAWSSDQQRHLLATARRKTWPPPASCAPSCCSTASPRARRARPRSRHGCVPSSRAMPRRWRRWRSASIRRWWSSATCAPSPQLETVHTAYTGMSGYRARLPRIRLRRTGRARCATRAPTCCCRWCGLAAGLARPLHEEAQYPRMIARVADIVLNGLARRLRDGAAALSDEAVLHAPTDNAAMDAFLRAATALHNEQATAAPRSTRSRRGSTSPRARSITTTTTSLT